MKNVAGRRLVDLLLVLSAMLIAFALRTVPAHDRVFRDGRVVFAGNDAWIHMRNADNAAAHAPSPGWFDPYRLAPEGQWSEAPLMDWLIAGAATMIGGGDASLDLAGAWFPAIAGALIVVPVFLLARRLHGRAAAVLAAFLIAVLPGQLLQRSQLGQTDHHVMEALLAATVLLLLLRAIERASGKATLAAGFALGAYLLAWSSAAFLLLTLLATAAALLAASVAWNSSPRTHARAIAGTFLIAAVVALPSILRLPALFLCLPLLAGGAIAILALSFAVETMQCRGHSPMRVAGGAILLVAIMAALTLAIPDVRHELRDWSIRFTPSAGSSTVGETRPLLSSAGSFSLLPLWSELTTSAILALAGLVLMAANAWRERSHAKLLFVVWSLAIIAATALQIRFGYYLAISAAVLSATAAVRFAAGLNRPFAVLAIAAIVIYPNVPRALAVGLSPNFGPSDAWLESLGWLRASSPEPFGDERAYLTAYPSKEFAPRPAYGVMAWCDYGYWITRIARRVPVANPTQAGARDAATFFTSTNEASAAALLERLHVRYVIVDDSMPMFVQTAGSPLAAQLDPMAKWAGIERSRLFELFYRRDEEGRLHPLFVYYPDYFRTMAIHLHAHDGDAWTPDRSTWAIASRAAILDGKPIRELTAAKRFDTFGEARKFVELDPRNWTLAGLDPLRSCVPLERLSRFAPAVRSLRGGNVAIFELRN